MCHLDHFVWNKSNIFEKKTYVINIFEATECTQNISTAMKLTNKYIIKIEEFYFLGGSYKKI